MYCFDFETEAWGQLIDSLKKIAYVEYDGRFSDRLSIYVKTILLYEKSLENILFSYFPAQKVKECLASKGYPLLPPKRPTDVFWVHFICRYPVIEQPLDRPYYDVFDKFSSDTVGGYEKE